MATLTGAQVWYVANVYPESVSPDEAAEAEKVGLDQPYDSSYWESAASVLTDLAQAPLLEKLAQACARIDTLQRQRVRYEMLLCRTLAFTSLPRTFEDEILEELKSQTRCYICGDLGVKDFVDGAGELCGRCMGE